MKKALLFAIACVWSVAGCRSPEAARRGADRDAGRLIQQGQADLFGASEPFTIEQPADTLRRRLMLEQQLPSATNAPSRSGAERPRALSFVDCLQVGARNNNEYQNLKESIFRAALDLDLQHYAFDSSFSGLLSASVESDTTGEADVNTAQAGFTTGINRKLKGGATLAANLTLDVVKLLTGDRGSSFGLLLDTTITIPLLRGAGREIVTEPLTQAERDLWYALLAFERFKKTYAVQVARDYLAVLRAREQRTIAQDNLQRLEVDLQRAERLAGAGRLLGMELDQTYQDVLRARNRLISARQRVEATRDRLKLTLGLPTDARIALDDSILRQLMEHMDAEQEEAGTPLSEEHTEMAVRTALDQRLDLVVSLHAVEDAQRKIRVAENALRAGVDLRLAGATSERRVQGGTREEVALGDGTYSAELGLDLPWDRRSERNAYRKTLIDLERARRALEAKEDEIKQDVRDAMRNLTEAREAYAIQTTAVRLAERRVKSTAMFLESGRAQTRDLLEAQEALVNARSALTDALVSFFSAYWGLLRGTGELHVAADGLWNVDYEKYSPSH